MSVIVSASALFAPSAGALGPPTPVVARGLERLTTNWRSGWAAAFWRMVTGIVAVVGEDFAQEDIDLLASRKIGLEGLERVPGKTFFWAGKYSPDMNDRETLRYVVNMGTIPLHVWSARLGSLDRPDWMILDLDPKDAPFASVVTIARTLHRILAGLRLPTYVKTSGATGLHVLVHWAGQISLAQVALMGVGAFVTARANADFHIPLPIAVILGMLGAVVASLRKDDPSRA